MPTCIEPEIIPIEFRDPFAGNVLVLAQIAVDSPVSIEHNVTNGNRWIVYMSSRLH